MAVTVIGLLAVVHSLIEEKKGRQFILRCDSMDLFDQAGQVKL